MEAAPTRWGIVSAGRICGDFCLAMKTLPPEQHRLVAVGARSLDRAETFAKKHGVTRAYGSYEEMSNDPDIDIVYIGTAADHVPLSIQFLSAGKHVLCEKPMSLTAAGARKVVDFAKEKKLLFVEGFWSRYFPAYKQLRQELADGRIGDVKGANVTMSYLVDWELPAVKHSWWNDRKLGGGLSLVLGCYTVQMACLVFNNEKPEKIVAHGYLHETGVDRHVNVMLCYKNGRTAHLMTTGDCQLPSSAVIYGTKGNLEITPPFWCPTELKTPTNAYKNDIPQTSEPTYYLNSGGFVYELQAVRQALQEGRLEMAEMTHEESVLIAEIQEELLRQIGITFDD